jgi:hypothetical protein
MSRHYLTYPFSFFFHPQTKFIHPLPFKCKSESLGCNVSVCEDCGHTESHNNSCRSRHCPNCQAVLKEVWVDKRRSEVIDSPYFHVVFMLPHELNPLLFCNRKLLTPFSTNAAHRLFWIFVRTKNISVQSLASYRSSTLGTRSFSTMSICTASSPEAC